MLILENNEAPILHCPIIKVRNSHQINFRERELNVKVTLEETDEFRTNLKGVVSLVNGIRSRPDAEDLLNPILRPKTRFFVTKVRDEEGDEVC